MGKLNEAQLHLEYSTRIEPFQASGQIRLFNVYLLKRDWVRADALIKRNLQLHEGRTSSWLPKFWRSRLSYLEFLKTKEKALYKIDAESTDEYSDPGEVVAAIMARDLEQSLEFLETHAPSSVGLTVGIIRGPTLYGWRIDSADVVKALVCFELGRKEECLNWARQAKDRLEEIVAGYHLAKPEDFAELAICYALEGDRERVEATIPKIRALTENVNWQFRAQASSEMKIAVAYLILGDNEKAIELLVNASQLNSPLFVAREADLWFIFDRLKGNPRFDALLED